jgi:hypothetical protein
MDDLNSLPLFNYRVAPHNGIETSRDAAEAIRPDLGRLHRLVLDTIEQAPDGMTCKEVEQATGLSHQTASARLNELAYCYPPCVVHIIDPATGKPRTRRTGPRSSGRLYFIPVTTPT